MLCELCGGDNVIIDDGQCYLCNDCGCVQNKTILCNDYGMTKDYIKRYNSS